MCIAVTALGIDTILPAYDDIRDSLGLDPDSTAVTALVTSYFMGNSLGLLPAGLLSDRFGRRAVMWGGLALYIGGAIGSVLAPSLGLMIVFRFIWGLGGAGPRVASLAMIRDGFAGEQMARQMSLVMAVFLVVPAIGPALSAGVLAISSWEWVFWMCAIAAGLVAVLVTRLPETLADTGRRSLSARSVGQSLRTVFATPGTVWYLVSLTALFGSFMSYLATSELIMDQTYDLQRWFPLFFGGLAVVMLGAMLVNSRFVERLGLRRLLGIAFLAGLASILALVVTSLATDGQPPFWLFVVMISAVLFCQQMLIPNLNAAAMRPLAEVAGTGAAVLGMVPGALGAVIGELMNRQFDGTITPLSIGFVGSGVIALLAWRRADQVAVAA